MDLLTVEKGGGDANYETKYQRSLRHYLNRDALPRESNYANLSSVYEAGRPSIGELQGTSPSAPPIHAVEAQEEEPEQLKGKVIKFGWVKGVLMRCMLNIWGVMLFLRVSWMVGQCGLLEALVIVLMGNMVTSITALSMSAVATNGLIKGGGVYYMISRSLGPEFGGSIGLIFTIANSIAVATYIIGFVNSLQDLLYNYFDIIMIDRSVNDIRAVGTGVLVFLLILAIVGMDWVTKVQFALWILLMVSQLDMVIGVFIGPMDTTAKAKGFVGLNGETFVNNLFRDYRYDDGDMQSIISVYAVFFPAVTGIVAGANLSGDLKDPATAIPKGTLLAIFITFVSYMVYPFMMAGAVVRDASGNVTAMEEFLSSSDYDSDANNILDSPVFSEDVCPHGGDYGNGTSCSYGLQNDFQVMELVAAWGPLIYAGCFAATLSSAIASLVGAPRILQALAKDKLYPGIYMFSKGNGANNDPVRGYLLVCVITLACIMIANLNSVSTLLTNFFLASYALINFSCFHASLIKSPGWRPSFRYYNLWLSLFGGVMCLIIMFLISYITALITLIFTLALYLFVSYRKPDVNWGDTLAAQSEINALRGALNLQGAKTNVKNYRPQVLAMTGTPSARPPLLDLAAALTKNNSFLSCGHVVKSMGSKARANVIEHNTAWLTSNKVRSFYSLVEAESLDKGAASLFQLVGLSALKPNMVLIGMKNDWRTCPREELKSYFGTLQAAFDQRLGLAILRIQCGLDYSNLMLEDEAAPVASTVLNTLSAAVDESNAMASDVTVKKPRRPSQLSLYHGPTGAKLPKKITDQINVFKRKAEGTIDVWWLFDDGGLTLLLPYLLTMRSKWSKCKLRIFTLANRRDELDMEQRSMATLLAKFRIDYDDVIVIPDAMRPPKDATKAEFNALIENFRSTHNEDGCSITDDELYNEKDKNLRHMRLREMVLENSSDASFIFMTLELPRKNHISAPLYLAWLDFISKGLPPFMFVRGNQTSVLTFYM